MAVRTATAAAVLAAAVAVYALALRERRLRRVLSRERASSRLREGCLVRDLEQVRRRINPLLAQQAVLSAAGRVVAESLARHDYNAPPMEGGGPR